MSPHHLPDDGRFRIGASFPQPRSPHARSHAAFQRRLPLPPPVIESPVIVEESNPRLLLPNRALLIGTADEQGCVFCKKLL
jgi:hypothetical protein